MTAQTYAAEQQAQIARRDLERAQRTVAALGANAPDEARRAVAAEHARIERERARTIPNEIATKGREWRFNACGAFAENPRPVEFWARNEWGVRLRLTTDELDAGLADGSIENLDPVLVCVDGPDGCDAGPVEQRWISDLRARPLCAKHQALRLDRADRAAECASDAPPAWFDEANAGERWDDDY